MSLTSASKLKKVSGAPTPFEQRVAKDLYEVGVANNELKVQMKNLYIVRAKEVEVTKGRSAAVVFIPYRALKGFRAYQATLTAELEKKMGLPVVFVAHRKIICPPSKKENPRKQQKRPVSRTLTAVYNSYLEDVCWPGEICDRRIRVKTDGKRHHKVVLAAKHKTEVADKLDVFSAAYRSLTGKDTSIVLDQ